MRRISADRMLVIAREVRDRLGPDAVFEVNQVGNLAVLDADGVMFAWVDLSTGELTWWDE